MGGMVIPQGDHGSNACLRRLTRRPGCVKMQYERYADLQGKGHTLVFVAIKYRGPGTPPGTPQGPLMNSWPSLSSRILEN